MTAVVAAFNQEKALVGAFSVTTNLRMELFEGLVQEGGDQPGRHEETPAAGAHQPRHWANTHLVTFSLSNRSLPFV